MTGKSNDDSSRSHVTLRAQRDAQTVTCSEIVTKSNNIYFGSFRVFARAWGAPGAVIGLFTYFNDTIESDIEILTKNSTDVIFYTNQPNTNSAGHTISEAGIVGRMPNGTLWTDWNVHRLDWLPGISRFFVNGTETAMNTYGVPNHASAFVLNVWSDGNKNWSGILEDGAAAYLEIQWVEMLFNISATPSGKTCKTTCAVDDVTTLGSPEVVSTSAGYRKRRSDLLCIVLAVTLLHHALELL